MIVGEHALAVEGGRDRDVQRLREADQCLTRPAPGGAMTREHDRVAGLTQDLRRPGDLLPDGSSALGTFTRSGDSPEGTDAATAGTGAGSRSAMSRACWTANTSGSPVRGLVRKTPVRAGSPRKAIRRARPNGPSGAGSLGA